MKLINKWSGIGGTILFLLCAWTVATIAQSTPPVEVDADIAAFEATLASEQAQYFAEHGRFAQILPSMGATIEAQRSLNMHMQPMALEGETSPIPTPAQEGVQCPDDQPDCPPVGLIEGVVVAVNVYEAPSGPGYEIVSEYVDDYGQTWRMVQNFGPEVWRNRSWYVVPDEN